MALAAPHGSAVPTDLAAILDKGTVNGLPVPVGGDVLIAAELALHLHPLLVAESQVAATLVDRASIGTIAIAVSGVPQVRIRTAMPVTIAAASTKVASYPIRSVRPIDLPAVGAHRACTNCH